MLRLGLCALFVMTGLAFYTQGDEPIQSGTASGASKLKGNEVSGDSGQQSGQKLTHDQQIAAWLKANPELNNPRGKLQDLVKTNELTRFEKMVLNMKATERAGTGEYWEHKGSGTYICRKCNAPLYRSKDKFDSHCGWPSFDDEIARTVTKIPDADGLRTEIVCTHCGGHLGHVFVGEQLTTKNTRHCVNSASIKFIPEEESLPEVFKRKDARKGGAPLKTSGTEATESDSKSGAEPGTRK